MRRLLEQWRRSPALNALTPARAHLLSMSLVVSLAAVPCPAVAQAKGRSLAEDLRIAANARNDVLLEPIADFELDSEGLVYVL